MGWIHLHPIVLFLLGHSTTNHLSFFPNTLLSSWNRTERFTKKQIRKWGIGCKNFSIFFSLKQRAFELRFIFKIWVISSSHIQYTNFVMLVFCGLTLAYFKWGVNSCTLEEKEQTFKCRKCSNNKGEGRWKPEWLVLCYCKQILPKNSINNKFVINSADNSKNLFIQKN